MASSLCHWVVSDKARFSQWSIFDIFWSIRSPHPSVGFICPPPAEEGKGKAKGGVMKGFGMKAFGQKAAELKAAVIKPGPLAMEPRPRPFSW